MKKLRCMAALLALTMTQAAAWDGTAYLHDWARDGVQAAYDGGAVDPAFALGEDYTRPVTRGELARLTVDLIAHERQTEVTALAETLGVTLMPLPQVDETPTEEENTDISEQGIPITPENTEESETEIPTEAEDAMTETEMQGETSTEAASNEEKQEEITADGEQEGIEQDAFPTEAGEGGTDETTASAGADIPAGDPLDGGLAYTAPGVFADSESVYVAVAAGLGVVTGADGRFRPHDPVSRAEAAAMLARCMAALGVTEANVTPPAFADAYDIPRWAVESVKLAAGRTAADGQAVMGGANGRFSPKGTYTVEQALLSIGRIQSTLSVSGTAVGWRDAPGYDTVSLALTFGGDCTLGRGHDFSYSGSFDEMYDQKGPNYFFAGISEFFDDDLTMVNFEGTLTDATVRAQKTFCFKGRAAYAQILRAGSIDVVSIANNHSMDYLQQGYDDTVRNLSPYVSISGYDRLPIVTVKGVRIGFASNTGWKFDEAQKQFIENAVQSLRARGADLVVFNYHWGIERDYHSDETQQAIGHYCIDQGADLVIGHHPHVVQEVEVYNGKPIAYSLGNLVFGGNHNPMEKNCLIFRQNFTLDLDARTVTASSYQALPYTVSSVTWRNDYRPTKGSF